MITIDLFNFEILRKILYMISYYNFKNETK